MFNLRSGHSPSHSNKTAVKSQRLKTNQLIKNINETLSKDNNNSASNVSNITNTWNPNSQLKH